MNLIHATIWEALWGDAIGIIWEVRSGDQLVASGTTPSYRQALEQVEIAWEQHSEDKP